MLVCSALWLCCQHCLYRYFRFVFCSVPCVYSYAYHSAHDCTCVLVFPLGAVRECGLDSVAPEVVQLMSHAMEVSFPCLSSLLLLVYSWDLQWFGKLLREWWTFVRHDCSKSRIEAWKRKTQSTLLWIKVILILKIARVQRHSGKAKLRMVAFAIDFKAIVPARRAILSFIDLWFSAGSSYLAFMCVVFVLVLSSLHLGSVGYRSSSLIVKILPCMVLVCCRLNFETPLKS